MIQAVGVFVALAAVPALHQDPVVGNIQGLPVRRVEIPNVSRVAGTFAPQKMSEWCWAASVSNVFAYFGHPVAQEAIVQTVYGRMVNLPSFTARTIAQQLNRQWTDANGKTFTCRLTAAYDAAAGVFDITNSFMMDELRAGRPIVYGSTHCMVITAIDYLPNGAVVGVGVFDPWPGSPRSRLLRGSDIVLKNLGGNVTFLASVQISDDSTKCAGGP